MTTGGWAAGIWSQNRAEEAPDSGGFVVWSRHSREDLAQAAARRYARADTSHTGGAMTWVGGVRAPSGELRWYREETWESEEA